MPEPWFTKTFSGIRIDIYEYKDNPVQIPAADLSMYQDGYYEVVMSVSKQNLSVTEGVHRALLVRPSDGVEHVTDTSGEYKIFPIFSEDLIWGVTWTQGHMDTPVGKKDADVILIHLQENDGIEKNICLYLLHDKDNWDLLDDILYN